MRHVTGRTRPELILEPCRKRVQGGSYPAQDYSLGHDAGDNSRHRACARGTSAKTPREESQHSIGQGDVSKVLRLLPGEDGKGNGPAAIALKPPPSDLTTLSKRHEGKFPAVYVFALVKFGRSLAAHGSLDMPVWGSRFKELDPVRDPTGQQHVDDVVAYIRSLQAK